MTIEAVATGGVQSSQPRFLPGTTNANSTVYCVYRYSTPGGLRNERMSRSLDGGATWSAPVSIDSADFTPEDQILGVDRINTSPSMAVDYASGRVYVVYQRNNSTGEGDIALRTFIGAPAAGVPVLLDSNPGSDRAQFYPAVTVDQGSSRAHVVWYDQDAVPTGDVTEVMHTSSTDGGATWSRPVPLTDRPFHAGYGNDTGQPNVGDYNQLISVGDNVMTTWGGTSVAPTFSEGQCATCGSMNTPDTYFDKTAASATIASLRLGSATFVESNCIGGGSNGFLEPNEIGDFTFPLRNYVVNASDSPVTYTGVSATLSTATPNVTILVPTQAYADIAPGATVSNASAFRVQLDPAFVVGTYVDLVLTVTTAQGDSTELPYRLATGSPGTTTTLLNENFDATAANTLPAGWSCITQTGAACGFATQPYWSVQTTLAPSGNAAFVSNVSTANQWRRLVSPVLAIPASATASFVEVEFDVVYKLEDDTATNVWAWDGLTLRITDQTGPAIRSVLAEAFAETLTTAAANHFPKHLPRSGSTSYFQDMSVWSGNSAGTKHIYMKFPGAGMAGRNIQLRFEYTEDSSGTCTSVGMTAPCGVAVDNLVVRHVVSADAHCSPAAAELLSFDGE